MPYEVRLEVFEGPLDLLLHLIQRNEVSITDIPIALVTRQYLETIELMQSLNLDVAGEYLVMAAYLTHIKSQMLLPQPELLDEGTDPGPDPRDELVAHLLEYKRYKEAALDLGGLPQLGREVFLREVQEEVVEGARPNEPIEVTLAELLDAFRALLGRTGRRDLIEVEPERLLVQHKIQEILARLDAEPAITFGSLLGADLSRANILVTLLALLETLKLRLITVYQDRPFGTILVSRRVMETAGDVPAGRAEA